MCALFDATRCVILVTSRRSFTYRFVTGGADGVGIQAIAKAKDQNPRYQGPAKDQYPRHRGPDGAEEFDKGRILGRYQSGMGQNKRDGSRGSSKARAVVFPMSPCSVAVVEAVGHG
jgi:hypothetical protein